MALLKEPGFKGEPTIQNLITRSKKNFIPLVKKAQKRRRHIQIYLCRTYIRYLRRMLFAILRLSY